MSAVPPPSAGDAARLLVAIKNARDAAERGGMRRVASLLRVALAMLKPSIDDGSPAGK